MRRGICSRGTATTLSPVWNEHGWRHLPPVLHWSWGVFVMRTLQLTRYALIVVLIGLVATALSIMWAVHRDVQPTSGLMPTFAAIASYAWPEHIKVGLPGWPIIEYKLPRKPSNITLLVMNLGAIVIFTLALCLLVRFERKEREAVRGLLTRNAPTHAEAVHEPFPVFTKSVSGLLRRPDTAAPHRLSPPVGKSDDARS